ncbi:hypothetical protein BB561_003854 [Smittium simulii]|uniref:Uncharacterized protein n=1 Tax=Smittium simulii TaxID=133385 RepID=A0A2T9YJE7_9FUNG|nr:hypothetical protein BB561_003854 [Smittium simulii]
MEKFTIPDLENINPLKFKNFYFLKNLEKRLAIDLTFSFLEKTNKQIRDLFLLDRELHLNRFHKKNVLSEINCKLVIANLDYIICLNKLDTELQKSGLKHKIPTDFVEKEYYKKHGRRAPVPSARATEISGQIRGPQKLSVEDKITLLSQAADLRKRRAKNPILRILSKRRSS